MFPCNLCWSHSTNIWNRSTTVYRSTASTKLLLAFKSRQIQEENHAIIYCYLYLQMSTKTGEMNLLHLPWHVNQINHMDDLGWNELNMIQTFCGKNIVLCRTTSTRHLLSKHEQVICWVLNKLTVARQGCTILIWNTSSISAAVVTV